MQPYSVRGSTRQRAAQKVLQALWFGVIPALLAALAVRFLIPATVSGPEGVIARVADRYGLLLGIALFFVFSLVLRHWRFHLPGGRYASALPAHLVVEEKDADRLAEWAGAAALHERIGGRAMARHLPRTLDPAARIALDGRRSELARAIETGDRDSARLSMVALEGLASEALASQRKRDALGLVAAVLAAYAAALALRARVVEPYRVLSASMLPTLEPADYVAGSHLAYRPLLGTADEERKAPRRGDVIVFRKDAVALERAAVVPDILIKRVIGVPGDSISMHGDVPVINGWEVPYCDAGKYLYIGPDGGMLRGRVRVEFLDERTYLTLQSRWLAFDGPYVVKPGEVFVLGDNRSNSLDSRAWNGRLGGGVPFEAIAARAQWFVAGNHRSGNPDYSRLLRPLDTLERRLHMEGFDAEHLEEGVSRCLRTRPSMTHPPDPPGAQAAAQDVAR
jgi:signal peptidase I